MVRADKERGTILNDNFKEAQERIIRNFEHDKQFFEWLKLPEWKRYEQDKINGIDDGEPPADYYRAHREEFDFNKEDE